MRHRRGLVVVGWIIVSLLTLPNARHLESVLRVAASVDASESATVDEQLARRFQSPFARSVVLVATGLPSPSDSTGSEVLRRLIDSLETLHGVTRVYSYLDGHEPLFVGNGGYFVVVGLSDHSAPDVMLDTLRGAAKRFASSLQHEFGAVTLRWTGETALNVDLRRKSADDARRAEWRALPVTLVLLLVAFGAIVAALLPIGAALLSIGVTLGIAVLIGHVWALSILLQNVVTMIGLGLGIDYSLLVLQRFRDELGAAAVMPSAARDLLSPTSEYRRHAATRALRHAGPTILLSASAVAIGFAALALIPVNELRSVGIGGLIVTAISMLVATTLVPPLLATLGRNIDNGRLPAIRQRGVIGWRNWANFVTRHPGRVLIFAGLPLTLLVWQSRRLVTGQPTVDWLPAQMESAIALRELTSMGRGAVVQTLRLTLELPSDVSAVDDSGWAATSRLARQLVADSAVARVRSLPGFVAPLGGMPRDVQLASVPDGVRQAFVSRDGRIAMLEVVPREGLSPDQLTALVGRIRAMPPASVTSAGASMLRVGGVPALNIDYEAAVAGPRQFTRVVSLIVIATFVVLAIGFRSLLVPLKAIVLNLFAVAAACGAVTMVFQDGIAASLLGMQGALGKVFPAVPVLVFCIVFGLSMDYEVFLVARVREGRLAGLGERESIANGLTHTARLITSAAAIMIAVFGAFMLGDFLLMKMLGFALAFAVLIDATVMRLAISPALLVLAGRWNWWPGERRARAYGNEVRHHGGEARPLTSHPERSEESSVCS